jgi:hypothetical protein
VALLALSASAVEAAARKPTERERLLITQSTIGHLHAESPRDLNVTGIVVSTIQTPGRHYTRYARAYAVPRIRNIETATVMLGLRRGYWYVLSYGTSNVGCSVPLGPRGPRIRTDLQLSCYP